MTLVGAQIGESGDEWQGGARWGSALGPEEGGACACWWGSCWLPSDQWGVVGRRASDDVRPSRDLELQSDAALGAVVTRVWLPAPRCPARGGLASGPGRADQVRAPGPLRHGPASRSLRIRRRIRDGLRRGVSMLDQVQGAFPSDSPASPSPCLNLRKGTLCFDRAAGGESL